MSKNNLYYRIKSYFQYTSSTKKYVAMPVDIRPGFKHIHTDCKSIL